MMTATTLVHDGHMYEMTEEQFDQSRLDVASKILQFGFIVMGIGYGECSVPGCDCVAEDEPWSYTVGCVELGHPEVVSLGCCEFHSRTAINRVLEESRQGRPLIPGDRTGRELGGRLVALERVPTTWLAADEARMATWFDHYGAGRDSLEFPEVVQLFIADDDGRFPWDQHADEDPAPILAHYPLNHPPRPPRRGRRC